MKTLFISNILPMKVINEMGRSVAGAQFQVSFAEELDKQLDGSLDLLSIVSSGHKQAKKLCNSIIFGNKKYKHCVSVPIPFIQDFFLWLQVFIYSLMWCLKFKKEKPTILILNAPYTVISPVLILKKMGLCRLFSFEIDSPFADNYQSSFYLKWKKEKAKKALEKLNETDGVLALNATIKEILGLTVPLKKVLLGFEPTEIEFDKNHYNDIKGRKKRLLFAGTLSHVNGVDQMLEAFSLLPESEYQLDICGYGPEENKVLYFVKTHKNCIYHGRVDQEELDKLYAQADLMMNIRLKGDSDNDFSFPSKLIGYLYSGKLVLSSDFSSLPDEYRNYLYVVNNDEPKAISDKVQEIFCEEPTEMNEIAYSGRKFICENQTWTAVVNEIVQFLKCEQQEK